MQNNTQESTIGVIVGRFQAHKLSNGHQELFEHVLAQNHNLNVVVLGKSSLGIPTKRNPLDIDSRMRMINEKYPCQFTIAWIEDLPDSDKEWSKRLDKIVCDLANGRDAVLYGSRDSFIDHYCGKYTCQEYRQKVFCSATEIRETCGKIVHGSSDFRAGAIWATQRQFDRVCPTVDVAIFDTTTQTEDEGDIIWMGTKKSDDGYRFIGGFTDPADESLEHAAKREVLEETGLEVDCLKYVCSQRMDDYRYRHEADKIITTLFVANVSGGMPKASDDIDELHRLEFNKLEETDIATIHKQLFNALKSAMR
jgi:bifunctional NMN adenylyltransferase/nudix hydrolase